MPTVPDAVEGLDTIVTGITMVNVTVALPVPPALMALTVAVNVPDAVSVPLITPVAVLTDNPAGNPLAAKPVGEFEAVME